MNTAVGVKARTAGALYFLSVLTAAFGELVVRGRLNVAVGLVAVSGMIAVTLLLYFIFKPVNATLCRCAAALNLVGLGFEALRFNPLGVDAAIVMLGFYCLLMGYLIFRSTFMPPVLAAPMAIAGLAWLTFVSPPLAEHLSPYNLACGILGEAAVCLWLLLMGVNVQRWTQQAGAARQHP
jgi:hypothetical protein